MRTSSNILIYGLIQLVLGGIFSNLLQAYCGFLAAQWAVGYAGHEDLVAPLHWHIVLRLKTEKL